MKMNEKTLEKLFLIFRSIDVKIIFIFIIIEHSNIKMQITYY